MIEEQANLNEPTKGEPSALVKVDIPGVKIDLSGIKEFVGALNNAINAISRGIGVWYDPIARVRNARADRLIANERLQTVIDQANKLDQLRRQAEICPESFLENQFGRAILYQVDVGTRKQATREKLAEAVAFELTNSPPHRDTESQIEDDWLTYFWRMSEDITNEQIQLFLARLLAREIKQPGAVSPLTLNVLSTLTQHAAARFEHFCRLSIRESENTFVIHPNVFAFPKIGPLDAFGVSYGDLYELEACGLISPTFSTGTPK
jgi:Protein of unknown function (DUF2806)